MDQDLYYSTNVGMVLETEPSFCNKITTRNDDVLGVIDENNAFKELSAYYNQIIRNSKTARKKTTDQVSLNRKLTENLPSRYIANKNQQVVNAQNSYTINKNLPKMISKSIDKITHSDSNYVCCSKNLPGIELKQKLTFVKSKEKHGLTNTEVNSTQPASAEKTTNCRPAIDLERFILKCMKNNDLEKIDQNIELGYAEKTTYCRPTVDLYSQEFIYKIMERNGRLRGLVRRLVLAREREKQRESWNNYINEIKNKHRHRTETKTISHNVPRDVCPEVINDFYNTRFVWQHSDPCQNLLQEYYGVSDEINSSNVQNYLDRPIKHEQHNYENERISLPMSSQGRFVMRNNDKLKNLPTNGRSRRYRGEPIFVNQESYAPSTDKQNVRGAQSHKLINYILNKDIVIKTVSLQTDLTTTNNKSKDDCKKDSFNEQLNKVNSNVERLKQKISQTQKELTHSSLASIENKLDVLIKSINSFVAEFKTQRITTVINEVNETTQVSDVSLKNAPKSDAFGIRRIEQIACGLVHEKTRSTLSFDEVRRGDTIDSILSEEKHKSNKVKKDIEDILTKPACDRPSVHITFDIPTKERSTEITASLSKTRRSRACVNQDTQMTIAVNTDPLGLLALFRVSAEAVKQILSYMPHINCGSYLPKLAITQTSRNETAHFVCNICGAAFCRPSQLSDHIQQHDLGNKRDCCVCRHMLDSQRTRDGLFTCQHCGQVFTRAYCREMHENICTRRLARPPDVARSLPC